MSDINLKNFKLNEEGSFSITRPYESNQILYFIENFMAMHTRQPLHLQTAHLQTAQSLIITDATACMGGDLIKFSRHFKIVNGIEIDPENFKLLIENCRIFNCNNINLFCQDYLEIYDRLKQDIIYLDAPWGGVGYKTKEMICLKMGDLELWQLINLIKQKNLAKYIFAKAPINVCLDNIEYDAIHIIYNKSKMPSFKLICIRL